MKTIKDYWQAYANRPFPKGLTAANTVILMDLLQAVFYAGALAALSELEEDPDVLEPRHAELNAEVIVWCEAAMRRRPHGR